MQVPSLVGELRSRSREPRSREGHAATAEPVCPSERIHGQGRKPHVPPRRPDTATLAGDLTEAQHAPREAPSSGSKMVVPAGHPASRRAHRVRGAGGSPSRAWPQKLASKAGFSQRGPSGWNPPRLCWSTPSFPQGAGRRALVTLEGGLCLPPHWTNGPCEALTSHAATPPGLSSALLVLGARAPEACRSVGPSAMWGQVLNRPSLLLTTPFPRAEHSI
ncbi:unnamed protein product [Rangifer tarandus platyrhynchus]|uniref:Uncharacterized protein n=1 Tax=Rangifer tarandus platyrhynchus TaxID=3082113 RepID=A0AC59ZFQ3_RANTA